MTKESGKLPPRRWIFSDGRFNAGEPAYLADETFPHEKEACDEYLSLQEHEALLQRARAEAFDAAVNSVSEWMILQQKAYEQGGFSFPKEAEREHGNTMRLLSCVQNSILRLAGREDKVIAKLKASIAAKAARAGKPTPSDAEKEGSNV